MADRIEQQFIIDAAQALNMLGKLNSGFTTFENRLRSTAAEISKFNSLGSTRVFNQFNTAVTRASKSMSGLGGSTQQVGAAATTASSGFSGFRTARSAIDDLAAATDRAGISFETFARIIQAQVIVRAINAIRDSFAEATREAIELQKQASLIETIATSATTSSGERIGVRTEEIRRATAELSNNLNIDQLEIAEGLYDAISNQVGDFAESLQFAAEAGKVARATNSTFSESVDTLSAVLRAYNLNADQTARISDILFATIDKGRVTASDLANTLGRVLPAASELGVTFEEVGASVAQISVGGLSSNETLTQIRATFSGLLKPSEALKDAFDEIGVASAEAGVRTFGFVGFLQRIRETAQGNASVLAELFPNVRNFGGVLALTAQQGALYEKTLRSISETQGLANESFEIVTSTDAERLTDALNKIQNEMIEVGEVIVSQIADFIEYAGGADAVAETIGDLARGFVDLVPKIAKVAALFLAASNGARVLNAVLALNPYVFVASSLTALAVALDEYAQAQERARLERLRDQLDNLREFDEGQVEIKLRRIAKEAQTLSSAFNSGLRNTLRGLTATTRDYVRSIDEVRDRNSLLVESVTDSIQSVVQAREQYVRELRNAATEADRIAQSSARRVTGIRDSLTQSNFDRSLDGLGDAERVVRLTNRARQVAQDAARILEVAASQGNEAEIQRALSLFNRAEQLGSTAESIADRIDNRNLEARAVQTINNNLQTQIRAEQQLQGIQKERQQALEREADRQEEIAKTLARAARDVIENTSLFNEQGERFSPEEIAARTRRRNRALDTLLENEFSQGEFDLANILGVADFTRKFSEELSGTTTTVDLQLRDQGRALTNQINLALAEVNTDPLVLKLKDAVGIGIQELIDPSQFTSLASRAEENFRNTLQARSQAEGARQRRNNARRQALEITDSLIDLQEPRRDGFLDRFTGGVREISDEVLEVTSRIQRLIQEGADPDELVAAYKEASQELDGALDRVRDRGDTSSETQFKAEIQNWNELGKRIQTIFEQTLKVEDAKKALREQADRSYDGIIQAAEGTSAMESNARNAATAFGVVGQQASNAGNAAQAAAGAFQVMAQAAAAAQSASAPSGLPGAYFGGFFNNGGFTRGMDTIPAMLSAGESVINARSTARFFSQIQAMNAGQDPVFRNEGGAVTKIGDIHVNVNNTSGSVDGRQIAQALERELRRNPNILRR